MRKILIAFPAAILILVSISLWGCGSDEEGPTTVPTAACDIELTSLFTGERFLPGAVDSQTVKIRWEKAGSDPLVNIDLLKGGNDVARLVSDIANSGYYSWRANNNGAEDGSDFSLRVSSASSSDCSSTSGEFVLLNTIGCTLEFTNEFPDSLHAGDSLTLSWENNDIPGLVDIVLVVSGEEPNTIATNQAPDGSYEWTVDTFGRGSFERFTFRIQDTKIPDYCISESRFIKIEDPL